MLRSGKRRVVGFIDRHLGDYFCGLAGSLAQVAVQVVPVTRTELVVRRHLQRQIAVQVVVLVHRDGIRHSLKSFLGVSRDVHSISVARNVIAVVLDLSCLDVVLNMATSDLRIRHVILLQLRDAVVEVVAGESRRDKTCRQLGECPPRTRISVVRLLGVTSVCCQQFPLCAQLF